MLSVYTMQSSRVQAYLSCRSVTFRVSLDKDLVAEAICVCRPRIDKVGRYLLSR